MRIVGRAATFAEGRGPDGPPRAPGCRIARGPAAAGLGVSDDAAVVEIGEALTEFWGANDEACCLGRFDELE